MANDTAGERDHTPEEAILSIGWVLHSLIGDGPFQITEYDDRISTIYADPIDVGPVRFTFVSHSPVRRTLWGTIQEALDAI